MKKTNNMERVRKREHFYKIWAKMQTGILCRRQIKISKTDKNSKICVYSDNSQLNPRVTLPYTKLHNTDLHYHTANKIK